jgi:mRNA interferase RelE/StbE
VRSRKAAAALTSRALEVERLATIVCSRRFDARFFALPADVRDAIERGLHELAARLDRFPHQRLKGVNAFKLRVGDYRVIYEFDPGEWRIDALAVGHRRDIYERTL